MIIHLDIYTYVYVDMSIVQKRHFKRKNSKTSGKNIFKN